MIHYPSEIQPMQYALFLFPLFIPTNFPHKKVTAASTEHIDHNLMMVVVIWHKAKSL